MRFSHLAIALLASILALPAFADEFGTCRKELRLQALAKGIHGRVFDRAMKGVEPDTTVLEAMAAQPEFETPIWEYLQLLVNDRRILEGEVRLAELTELLERIEREYGVDKYTLVAVWGVETDYGRIMGTRSLVRSLATISCFGERQKFFRDELFAALRIVQDGDIKLSDLRGSWAGAFGHAQFMPSTFQRLAVDFDGDGKRDLIGSIPDSLASIGNYLRNSGWQRDQPWGYEVRLPTGYEGPSGRVVRKPLAEWSQLGIVRIDGQGLVGEGSAALVLPTGARGPAFIVFHNFDAIFTYNRSESYAIAIAHLSDRLRGGAAIQAAWPTDDPMLSRSERRELQTLLNSRGYLEGEADGIVGSRTIAAIKAFQTKAGMPSDGYASSRVLKALRSE